MSLLNLLILFHFLTCFRLIYIVINIAPDWCMYDPLLTSLQVSWNEGETVNLRS